MAISESSKTDTRYTLPDWPRADALPGGTALFKQSLEDFVVDEVMDVELSGSGEFLWLKVCKRGINTQDVANLLAKSAGLAGRAVSHSGLKDRQSISTQWFSLHLPGKQDPELPAELTPQITIVERRRHLRKLRIGTHRANRFSICLKACEVDQRDMEDRCQMIVNRGVPNYFGGQRFGRGGDNLRQVISMYTSSGRKRRSRHLEGLLHSSARAFLFNQVLAVRVHEGTWHTGKDDDIWMLSGTRSIFGPEALTDELVRRCQQGDIAPTGPLYGRCSKDSGPAGESEVMAQYPELTEGLDNANARPARRRLALRPTDFTWDWCGRDLTLKFELSRGEFATGLMRELVDLAAGPR